MRPGIRGEQHYFAGEAVFIDWDEPDCPIRQQRERTARGFQLPGTCLGIRELCDVQDCIGHWHLPDCCCIERYGSGQHDSVVGICNWVDFWVVGFWMRPGIRGEQHYFAGKSVYEG
jgi:hypothetical protein